MTTLLGLGLIERRLSCCDVTDRLCGVSFPFGYPDDGNRPLARHEAGGWWTWYIGSRVGVAATVTVGSQSRQYHMKLSLWKNLD